MARTDIAGFFWDDTPPPKPPPKIKEKRTPPEPVWLRPDYLPGLEQALSMRPDYFTDAELVIAQAKGERLVWDIECYPNYFLVAFKSVDSGKILCFEMVEGECLDLLKLNWVLRAFVLIDYNGNNYDVPIVSLAAQGKPCSVLFEATDAIINEKGKDGRGPRPADVLKRYKVSRLEVNHIDLIELVALKPSLKLLAGRLHCQRMQDLPFVPGTRLSPEQVAITRWYCVNDLDNTKALYFELLPDIQLRERMSARYGGIDLRSKSDAQIAEAVISSEIKKITGQKRLFRPTIEPGTMYKYNVPSFIRYQTPLLNWVLDQVRASWFQVGGSGKVLIPEQLKSLKIEIANGVYRMGNGGLHSSEKRIAHYADEHTLLCDRDVASYYPRIILNCLLAPAHLGAPFLRVYNGLVNTRLNSKNEAGALEKAYKTITIPTEVANRIVELKTEADGLKIVVNGSFGKLGSKWSVLYSPDLMIQVTITGQLSLLMLIERLELADIPVVSANTDGIVIKCPKARKAEMDAIVAQWEKDTGFETEETRYSALFSRDVNNYFAVKEGGGKASGKYLDERLGVKVKGVFSERGSSRNSILAKNPQSMICSDAVQVFLTKGTPVEQTIQECQDIRRFFTVRTVRGGAVKDGQYLGKAIRWYYAKGYEEGEIVYAKSGNLVPKSIGAKPCMELPEEFPQDVNYDWYIAEAHKYLKLIGWEQGEVEDDLETEDEETEEAEMC